MQQSNEVSGLLSTEVSSWSDALEDTGSLLDMAVEGSTYMSLTKRASKMLGEEAGLWDRNKIKQDSVYFLCYSEGQEVGAVLPEGN